MTSQATGLRALDLFCGAGGLSLGFQMAGGLPVGGIDFDRDSIATYTSNFPAAQFNFHGAIESWEPSSSLFGQVEVLIGGPPCQGFSLARGSRFVDDPRNSLYKHFVRAVSQIRPEWFVMENVEGILNIGGGQIREQILEDFAHEGYFVEVRVINMADFGVPQRRKRAIFVGNRMHKKFEWPAAHHAKTPAYSDNDIAPHRSVSEALSDLDLAQGNYFAHRANSQMRGPRNRLVASEPAFTLRVRGDEFALCEHPAVSSFIPGGRPAEPTHARNPSNSFQDLMQNWSPTGKSVNIMNRTSRVSEVLRGTRRLTIREQARLQSFPDAFQFTGSVTSQARQIGNAVPPLFGKVLFEAITNQA